MSRGLPKTVRACLQKCRSSAIAAVDAYNRPGPQFRTAQYLVLITMAWTGFFHAYFYSKKRRPWFRKKTTGTGVRYQKIDGEPRHWDLAECLKQFYGEKHPPERKNLQFLLGLRNKIEHRELPELDASLYGECQAALLNLETAVTEEFGGRYAFAEQLAVSLQMTRQIPAEKKKAAQTLAKGEAKSVGEYIQKFRGNLPSSVLSSMKYSFNVFLVPRVVNRENAADAAVQFVPVDEASEEELKRLERLNILIREKQIPIANLDMHKPSHVVAEVEGAIPFRFTMPAHTAAWRHYSARPDSGSENPERTRPEFCIYDKVHNDYQYSRAWIERLKKDLADPERFKYIIGREPEPKD